MRIRQKSKKLPVFTTAKDIVLLLIGNWRYAVRISWPWLILMALVYFPVTAMTVSADGSSLFPDPEKVAQQISGLVIASYVVGLLVAAAGWSSMAVLWHRHVLLGEKLSGWPVSLGRNAMKYLGRFIFIVFLVLVPSTIIAFLSDQKIQASIGGVIYMMMASVEFDWIAILAGIALSITVAIISLRLSVSLPAAALGVKSVKPLVSWRATSGNSMRLLAVAALVGAPAFALNWLVYLVTLKAGLGHSTAGLLVFSALSQSINFIFVILGVTLLSLAYAFLLNVRPAESMEEESETLDSTEPGPVTSAG